MHPITMLSFTTMVLVPLAVLTVVAVAIWAEVDRRRQRRPR